MIIGIGIDAIEIKRFSNKLNNKILTNGLFTEKEMNLINGNTVTACDNFVVKEAFTKMIGTGIRDFKLNDIEVLRDKLGKPYINLYNNALKVSKKLNIDNIFVSITNTDNTSIAVVVGEKCE